MEDTYYSTLTPSQTTQLNEFATYILEHHGITVWKDICWLTLVLTEDRPAAEFSLVVDGGDEKTELITRLESLLDTLEVEYSSNSADWDNLGNVITHLTSLTPETSLGYFPEDPIKFFEQHSDEEIGEFFGYPEDAIDAFGTPERVQVRFDELPEHIVSVCEDLTYEEAKYVALLPFVPRDNPESLLYAATLGQAYADRLRLVGETAPEIERIMENIVQRYPH